MTVNFLTALALTGLGFAMAHARVRYCSLVINLVNSSLFYIAIPMVIFGTIYTAEGLHGFSIAIAVSLTHIAVLFFIAYATYRSLKLGNPRGFERDKAFALSIAMPNAAYLAIPLSTTLLGDSRPVIPYTIAFNIALPIVIAFLSLKHSVANRHRFILFKTAPFLSALLLAFAAKGADIQLPHVDSVLKAVSAYTISSFLLIGYELAKSLNTLSRGLAKELLAAATLRYTVSPTVMLLLAAVSGNFNYISGLVLQSVMPPAVSNIVVAKMFKLDVALVTVLISMLTPISIAIAVALSYLVL